MFPSPALRKPVRPEFEGIKTEQRSFYFPLLRKPVRPEFEGIKTRKRRLISIAVENRFTPNSRGLRPRGLGLGQAERKPVRPEFEGLSRCTPELLPHIDRPIEGLSGKRVIDGYALWRISPEASLRLSVANASARDYSTGSTLTLADDSTQSQDTLNRSYTTVSLRAELRF